LDNGLVIEVDPGRFEEMVAAALDGLPEELGQLIRSSPQRRANIVVDQVKQPQPMTT